MTTDLIFDMSAYSYIEGLKAIRLMFEAACKALSDQSAKIHRSIDEYQQHLDTGGEPIGEWEDGHRLWDQDDLLRLENLAIAEAGLELRVATTIAIYHHWERSIPCPNGSKNRYHERLVEDAINSGINLHKDVDALCFATNYLKHGTEKWRAKLLDRWPDRFSSRHPKNEHSPSWIRKLHLDNVHVEWFLEIAHQSERPLSNHRIISN
ncbi:hypothetical protein [Parasphingorhabdus sp.]|uniref:hypothetical protein n=1 Tax=Parasphingorhabdus sp. TaxID=2709688 RepID=UPI003A9325A6